MQPLKELLKNKQIKPIKKAKYKFQEICLEIIKIAKIPKHEAGLVFHLWKRGGYPVINKVLAELKAGEIKNPIVYIKWLIGKLK